MHFSDIARPAVVVLCGACATLLAGHVSGQEIYRSKSATGTTLYTDQAPSQGATPLRNDRVSVIRNQAPTAGLPAALQDVVQRYPVALYTSPDCAPCDDGRQLLRTRGVPFQEYTVATAEDHQAMSARQIATMPHLTVGRQALRGFDSQEWARYLDAAGYPATSALPADYAFPTPLPLAGAVPAAADDAAAADTGAAGGAPALPLDPSNLAGIRF